MKSFAGVLYASDQVYTICKHCDHFVERNTRPFEPDTALYCHLDNGEQEYDHDAEPGETHTKEEWLTLRSDLFVRHPDGKYGPNSNYHSQRGKLKPE